MGVDLTLYLIVFKIAKEDFWRLSLQTLQLAFGAIEKSIRGPQISEVTEKQPLKFCKFEEESKQSSGSLHKGG